MSNPKRKNPHRFLFWTEKFNDIWKWQFFYSEHVPGAADLDRLPYILARLALRCRADPPEAPPVPPSESHVWSLTQFFIYFIHFFRPHSKLASKWLHDASIFSELHSQQKNALQVEQSIIFHNLLDILDFEVYI